MRRYWSGEGSLIGEVSGRMTGSSDLFNHDGRKPRASVNHITVHDGFTLADLFSYNEKHNEANGEDNRDGSSDNHSNNCGHEGPTDDADINALRRQLRRNQLACLLLAQGLPLLLAGDEVGNSQRGNNNAYCQDNEVGWVEWTALGHNGDDLTEFVSHLTALRRRFAQIRATRWLDGRRADGSYGVLWLTPSGADMKDEDWKFPEGRFLVLCAGAFGTRSAADLYRLERSPRRDRFQASRDARIQELAAGPQHDRRRADDRRVRSWRRDQGAAPLGAGLCGAIMSDRQFGARPTADGVSFRLWAPAAHTRRSRARAAPSPCNAARMAGLRPMSRGLPPARATNSGSTTRSTCPIPHPPSSPTTSSAPAR